MLWKNVLEIIKISQINIPCYGKILRKYHMFSKNVFRKMFIKNIVEKSYVNKACYGKMFVKYSVEISHDS